MSHHPHHPHPHRPSRLSRLPTPLSHFLGYRTRPLPPRPPHIVYLWSFIGSFVGLSVIQAVFGQARYFIERGVPSVVASYGATAVLVYGAIDAPLAQPLATFGGHFLGALIGVCITKLFSLIPDQTKFESLLWLSGSLACSTTIVVMQITGTTHPPAGATALLASTNPDIRALGWYYLPVVILTSVLVLAVALINNNIQRRYPVFWYKPDAPGGASVVSGGGKGVVNGLDVRGVVNGLGAEGKGVNGGVNGQREDEREEERDVKGDGDVKGSEKRNPLREKSEVTEVREREVDGAEDGMTETEGSRSRSRAGSRRDVDSVV